MTINKIPDGEILMTDITNVLMGDEEKTQLVVISGWHDMNWVPEVVCTVYSDDDSKLFHEVRVLNPSGPTDGATFFIPSDVHGSVIVKLFYNITWKRKNEIYNIVLDTREVIV
jgi:hypothetical protein